MTASRNLPLVSVVTPSYNMGEYLRETIESVLTQDYPHIEYIVMDAGSTDGTLDILRQYESRLRFESKPDGGAADAVNRGFLQSRGCIFAFLNADDTYLPGAISAAVRGFLENADAAVIYGEAYWTDRYGRILKPYPTRADAAVLLGQQCFICQPASFLRRAAFEEAGMLDAALKYTFDYDLWIRLSRIHAMKKLDSFVATARMHKQNKTLGERRQTLQETIHLLLRHFGYAPFDWLYAYVCHALDGRDQFFEPMQPSIAKYLMSVFVGLRYNWRQPFRFIHEWASVMSIRGFLRRCSTALPRRHHSDRGLSR
jgi:glycosyltransferase involved in cell wall biosynthesis